MKVILLENIKRIGSIGEIIDVKRGFARNFLIANPCHRHGHGHRSGLGRSWERSVFKGINGIAIQNFSTPKIFDSQSIIFFLESF